MKQSTASTRANGSNGSKRRFSVTPIACAVRSVLAISGALLALGGSGTALAAGSCVPTAANTFSCNGDFAETVPGGIFAPVVDMTLVLGDSAATSVTPASGQIGVEATWGGDVGVTSFADISTDGADGMLVVGTSSATVDNEGSITTNVSTDGAMALDVYANGSVSIVNGGDIHAYSTGVYDVTAINVYSSGGDVLLDNLATGTITAQAQDGNAIAILSFALGSGSVSNEGVITANSVNGVAIGVLNQAYLGDADVTNSGSITADSSYQQAIAVLASSSNGFASVSNSGLIQAFGGEDQSIGIEASSLLGSSVDNSGQVYATSSLGESIGIQAQSYDGVASVTNSGTIHISNHGPYAAIGVLASSVNDQASIDNSGFIQSINYHGDAIGLEADGANGSTINNSGYILGGSYTSNATGILATATSGDVVVNNTASGYIRTVTLGADYFEAIGVTAHSTDGTVNVSNDGSIFGFAVQGKGEGIEAIGGGDVYVGNSGHVTGKSGYYGDARGIVAGSENGAVTVVNSGDVFAFGGMRLGELSDVTTVDGIFAVNQAGRYDFSTGTYGPTAITTVVNSGYVKAAGAWFANGIVAGSYGGTSVTNTASGSIYTIGLNTIGIAVIETPNSYANYGVGEVTVTNDGSIRADQRGDCNCSLNPYGYGIKVISGMGGDIAVSNTGSIAVNTQHGGAGIFAYGYIGETNVSNSGSITISAAGAQGRQVYGVKVLSAYGGVYATSSGDITIVSAPVAGQSYAGNIARGMFARAGRAGSNTNHGGDDAILVNTGQIDIHSAVGYGMWSNSHYGLAQASNSGTIVLDDSFSSFGITANAGNAVVPGEGSVLLENTGSVSAVATNQAIGLRAFTSGSIYPGQPGITATIDNSGYVGASSQQRSQGILAFSPSYDVFTIDNSGSVVVNTTVSDRTGQYAAASGAAVGIHTALYKGDATITNSGDIVVATQENNQRAGTAAGIYAANGTPQTFVRYLGIGYGDTSITNTGSISASLVSSNTLAPNPPDPSSPIALQISFGPFNTASGIIVANTYGDVAIANGGTITASAQSDHYTGDGPYNGVTTSNGIAAVSNVGTYDYTQTYSYVYNPATGYNERVYDGVASTLALGDIMLGNGSAGIITAYASATDAVGNTAVANGMSGLVTIGNYGGSLVSTDTGITIANDGTVSATAMIANDPTGIAIAHGISAINESTAGFVNVSNTGSVFASATAPSAATATGLFASAHDVTVVLNSGGYVGATATGTSGMATGLSVSGDLITASNAGALRAEFIGAGGLAYGALITSTTGDVTFSNSGQIFAANTGDAIGVQLNGLAFTTLINSGSISAASTAASSIAVRTGGACDAIENTGIINGAILTGDADDTLDNGVGGVWHAIGSSDFGAGDDIIINAGTIFMDNASITLGSYATLGNQFTNSGLIGVSGDNQIDLGALNPNPFTNTGTISFRDGLPEDMLTIAGDFGGDGNINLDVSGLHNTADLLYINGNVVDGNVTTINANILDVPTTATGSIAVVNVTGDSTAGSFVLGDVTFDTTQSFLTVQGVSLQSAIDTSNATADVFSMDFAVTGLTDTGTLAAAFAPGVQSLMNSQVGTWRQRMGVIDKTTHGPSIWARAFQDDGTVNPTHQANDFGQGGSFAFDQRNSGQEVGVDFGFSDQFSVGLLLGKAHASQHLTDTATGSSKLDGDTTGVYATWISPNGFYVDASYRHMSFDAKLTSAAGQTRTDGKADAFNIEAGYAWTLGNGFKLEPQLQYTHTTVDDVDTLSGALAGFNPDGGTSSRGRLGLSVRKSFSSGNAVWTPYATVSAVREFDGENAYSINGNFSGSTSTEGTSALVEGGLNVQIGKLSLFGGLNWQDGGALDSVIGGQVGVRYSW